jgi:hypothetical protein
MNAIQKLALKIKQEYDENTENHLLFSEFPIEEIGGVPCSMSLFICEEKAIFRLQLNKVPIRGYDDLFYQRFGGYFQDGVTQEKLEELIETILGYT